MRKHRLMLFIVSAMILGLASFTAAHMMGGEGHSQMNGSDSNYQPGMMGMGMMGDNGEFYNMMGNMPQYCNTMTDNFDQLENNFQKMMQINDNTALKKEMQKHYDMMQEMYQNMTCQQNVWHTMMSMMYPEDPPGTEGQSGQKSDQSGSK